MEKGWGWYLLVLARLNVAGWDGFGGALLTLCPGEHEMRQQSGNGVEEVGSRLCHPPRACHPVPLHLLLRPKARPKRPSHPLVFSQPGTKRNHCHHPFLAARPPWKGWRRVVAVVLFSGGLAKCRWAGGPLEEAPSHAVPQQVQDEIAAWECGRGGGELLPSP